MAAGRSRSSRFQATLSASWKLASTTLLLKRSPTSSSCAMRSGRSTNLALSVRDRFLTLMCQRVCDMQNHLMVLGRQTAKERVASFLLVLLDRIGFEEDDVLDVPMSRQDIADNLGLTIETVCRTLSELKRGGVIDIPNQRQLRLFDVEALQSLAAGED